MINSNTTYPPYLKATVLLLMAGLIISFMVAGKDLLVPLTIAIFFTFLLLPVSRKLESWKIPKAISILISIFMAMIVFGSLLYFIYLQIISFGSDMPELQKALNNKLDRLILFIIDNFNISQEQQTAWFQQKIKTTAASGDQYLMTLFSMTGSLVASMALIPIYIFFLTYYKEKYHAFVCLIFKDDKKAQVITILQKVALVSQKYLKGVFLDILILSVLNSTGFLLLGLKHAILFGVVASILNIIPYIGVLIGSLLPVAMALLTKDEIGYALGAAGVCVIVQFLDNNFITPYVVGSSVSINPLAATIALVASALIWGIPGMILCIPITGTIKVIFDNIEPLKPYGYILGEEVDYRKKAGLIHWGNKIPK